MLHQVLTDTIQFRGQITAIIFPGKSFSINHIHFHDVQPFASSDFNLTHTVRHLSFGRNVVGRTDPMDGVQGIADKPSSMFHYYIKIVPTSFTRVDGSIFDTNQFSVTRHHKVRQGPKNGFGATETDELHCYIFSFARASR